MKRSIPELIIEAVLIIFSIIAGMYFQGLAAESDLREKKAIARGRVTVELDHNLAIVESAVAVHTVILDSIAGIRRKPTLPKDIRIMDPRVLGTRPILEKYPAQTAWKATVTSGIISEFDFNEIEMLTDCYNIQDGVVRQVEAMGSIILASPGAEFEASLGLLESNLSELVGREGLLLASYKDVLQKMNATHEDRQ